jgi:hypothetical protein
MIHIDKHTRNKIYWIDYSDPQKLYVDGKLKESNLAVINLGFSLASLFNDKVESQVIIMTTDYLNEVMEAETNLDSSSGLPYVIIKNIGILQEHFLDINPEKYLLDFSKNTGVILLWEGKVINNQQFLWPDTNEYSLTFKDTNVQKIDL